MALVWIAFSHAKSTDCRAAIAADMGRALVEAYGVGGDRLIQIVTNGAADVLRYDHAQAGSGNSVELVLVQVTAEDTRGAAQKQAFYRRLVELLGAAPGFRPDDILVNLVDVPKKNWFRVAST